MRAPVFLLYNFSRVTHIFMNEKTDWNSSALPQWYNRMLGFTPEQMYEYLARFDFGASDTLVDFGCGNGEFLYFAAPLVKTALGVDESAVQLELAREKNAANANVSFLRAKFEDALPDGLIFTKGSARKSLHHLTDENKARFFKRAGGSFARDARFIIEDAVLDFELKELGRNLIRLDEAAANYYGARWPDIKPHFMQMFETEFPASLSTWKAAAAEGGFELASHTARTCFYGILELKKS